MRYYNFTLNTTPEQIEEHTTIRLKDYHYDNTIGAVNTYMYRNLKSGISFFVYQKTEHALYAAFSFEGQKESLPATFAYLCDMLHDAFLISITDTPFEITMFQFLEQHEEGRRRAYITHSNNIKEWRSMWVENCQNPDSYLPYTFEERIAPDYIDVDAGIYDKDFLNELSDIEASANASNLAGNAVHYVLSCKSTDAAAAMAEALIHRLFKANRIGSQRVEVISEIAPDLPYVKSKTLVNIIENNYGGAIVFDLTEKFGHKPEEYLSVSTYIERLLKRYRNHCLFIFTYNMEQPGFSYYLLPQIKKYVTPVMLREGRGNRKAAIRYMRSLIKESDYAAYTGQAAEFMRRFPDKDFSQSDVLAAYEQFEPWCISRNILHRKETDLSEEFMLDRDVNTVSSYEKLQKLIGLKIVKEQIDCIIVTDILEQERKKRRGRSYRSGTMHMIFSGNPGTAKTTVARLFAGIAKEQGILKSGSFVERSGIDLDGMGCVSKIRNAFIAAKGGVLFIDEAYAMCTDTAITTLIQELENKRDEVIVVFAGYNERMLSFMEINEGLKSRIPYWIEFPDYTTDELTAIFRLMIEERGFRATDAAVSAAHYIFDKIRITDNFGNGRYVRNLMERATQNQSVRLMSEDKKPEEFRQGSLFLITGEDVEMLEEGLVKERPVGSAQKELDDMIGLASVKNIIRKAIAGYKMSKLCLERGLPRDRLSLHMVFTGNPGTAKTTVARLFAEIMKDEKVLPTGTFIEVGRADLISPIANSAPAMVRRKFREAKGGVLFIDEAYALCDGHNGGSGDEAINTLVQEMENHREDVIVIFAGYPEPMQEFLDRNPGMLSRIAFRLEFEDYTTEELLDIARLMVAKKQMSITDDALEKLRAHFEHAKDSPDYGNGRFVRKLLEEAEMNLAERLLPMKESEITTALLSTIEACDIPEVDTAKNNRLIRIGFAA